LEADQTIYHSNIDVIISKVTWRRDIDLRIQLDCCVATDLKMQVTGINVGSVVLIHTYLTFRV
jgi:hypothetical protein